MLGLDVLKSHLQCKQFYDFLHSLASATQQEQLLFTPPSTQTSFSLQLVRTMARTPLPSEHSKDVWKDWYSLSCLGTLLNLCVLHWVVERLQDTLSIPTLFWHSAITVKCCWVQWHMLTESLNTSSLHSNVCLLCALTAQAPQHKPAFCHQPTSYSLITGNDE